MKLCMPHWKRLMAAVEEKGMMHLVHASGEELAASMIKQMDGTSTKADFDPLANATWAIYGQFLENVGLGGLMDDICPLCDVDAKGPATSQNWIEGSTQEQLDIAVSLGLMPKQSIQ